MLVNQKYKANGDYDKTKARLVADGRGQDAKFYPDKSFPTLQMQSLYTLLAMYAGMYGYCMAKVDIKGALVQTPMEAPDGMYMRIQRKLVAYLLEIFPQIAKYVQADGSIVTQLQKAMYGCVQASKLWYNQLWKVLKTAGFVVSEVEPCVMRKVVNDMILSF
jgi:hypothetical protein